MSTLKVRAHWTNSSHPIPASLSPYGTPPNMATSPTWPTSTTGSVAPNGVYHVWCPLAAQADLDTAQWGANTVAPPPAWPLASGAVAGTFDQGYSKAATDFTVTGLRLWQDGRPGTDFTYTVTAPNGTVVGSVTPTGIGWATIPVNTPITSGKGLWKVDIDRAPTSSAAAPTLRVGAPPSSNGVDEPYVSPYGNAFEGILGLEFTGSEVTQTCVDIKVTHSGIVPCMSAGQSVTVAFTASFTPATPPYTGTVYWQVRDSNGNTLTLPTPTPTGPTLTFTFTQQGQYQVTASIFQQGCPNPAPSDTDTINIVGCTCPSIIGSPNGIQVNSANGCTFSFSVQISNPSGGTTIFTWDFGDGTGPHVLSSSVTWTYPALSSGVKTVSVTLTSNDPTCKDKATTQVQVKCGATTPTPTTSTPTPTTPTPTPTPTPTTTGTGTGTGTPTPTPTPTPTSTSTSGGGGFGLCGFSVLVALILFGIAAVGLAVGGCLGPAGSTLMASAVPVAATGFVILGLWMLFCRNCKLMRFLQRFFGAMALMMAAIAAVLALIGMVTCSFGAAAVALLFAAIVAAVSIGIAALRCP